MISPSTKELSPSSCPCCVFLADDLFLPPSVATTSTNGVEKNDSAPSLETIHPCLAEVATDVTTEDIAILDTHSHAHLERLDEDQPYIVASDGGVSLITCAVAVDDWDACVQYAAQSSAIVPAIGVHPWYCESLLLEDENDTKTQQPWLERLASLLQQHPGCIVGEIGLCKLARWVRTYPAGRTVALEGQRRIFVQQLRLAAQYQRPVSVHCVQQHGVLLHLLQEQADALPPAMALHSFTGTAHHVQQLLQFEPHSTTKFYFGFSHTVNVAMTSSDKSRRQTEAAIRAVPFDRLLVESDVHRTDAVRQGTLQALLYLAQVLGNDKDDESVTLQSLAQVTRANGLAFLQCGRETDSSSSG